MNAESLVLLQPPCLYACVHHIHTNTGVADLEGSYVDDLLSRVMIEDPQHGQLSTDGLAGPCRRSQQHILICMVQGVESLQPDLCLFMLISTVTGFIRCVSKHKWELDSQLAMQSFACGSCAKAPEGTTDCRYNAQEHSLYGCTGHALDEA